MSLTEINSLINLRERITVLLLRTELSFAQSNNPLLDNGLRSIINALQSLLASIEQLIDQLVVALVQNITPPK